MKIRLTCSFILLLSYGLFAQQKPYTIQRDTIILHGYIYDNMGKPLKLVHIQSAQRETEHNYFKAGAYTDINGYFELKDAKFNDTLTVGPDLRYDIPPYYNRDSRYMVIYLPAPKITDINSNKAFVITQKRISPKKAMPSFTIQPFSDIGAPANDNRAASFPGGIAQLEAFVNKNLTYPPKALKNNIEGTVQVQFTVEKDGKVNDFKVLRGVGYDCDEEAIKVIKHAGKWSPAIDHDNAVPALETVAIQFKLAD